MSEAKSGHDWAKDWQALQRQYWTAWSDLTRNQASTTPDAATPWHEGLEQWARMFGSAGKQSEAAERLMASAKNYLGLMQSMLAFAAGKGSAEAAAPSWFDALRNGMNLPGVDPTLFANMPGIDAALLNNPMAKALRDISGPGLKSFEQLASGALPMLQQFQNEGMSWLQTPAFGYLREHQEHYQKMALAFAEFQKATQQYNALMLKASQRSFEILEGKVAERSEPGRQIDSMRALYDLWVDAAEDAYAEVALSEEFRKVYGDVVNAQMRVRSQLQQEVERISVDLGMPSRTELNSVHKRLHELRRELRNGHGAAEKSGSAGRDAEIAALRREVAELKRLLENFEGAPQQVPAPKIAPKTLPVPLAEGAKAKPMHAPKRARRPTSAKRAARAPAAKPARAAHAPVGRVVAAAVPKVTRAAVAPATHAVAAPAPKAAQPPRPARARRTVTSKPARSASAKKVTAATPSFSAAIAQIRRATERKKPVSGRLRAPAKATKPLARRIRGKA